MTYLVTTFGTQALAGYGIGTRLEFLLVPIAFAVGVASVPLVGVGMAVYGISTVLFIRYTPWSER